jgi:hypothetical protein
MSPIPWQFVDTLINQPIISLISLAIRFFLLLFFLAPLYTKQQYSNRHDNGASMTLSSAIYGEEVETGW